MTWQAKSSLRVRSQRTRLRSLRATLRSAPETIGLTPSISIDHTRRFLALFSEMAGLKTRRQECLGLNASA